MEKLIIFTNHYYPESFRINALSKEFSKFYDINVITQTPNYPKGRFYDGYSIFKKRIETIDNIQITRLPVIPRGGNSITLSLNYVSYIVSSFFYRIFTKKKADHVLVYITSPIFISYAALAFAKKNNAKSTLYLLDLWPGALISILKIKNKFIIKRLEKMCGKLYKRFDNIIVSSQGFIEVLKSYGVNQDKIKYVPQHADETMSHPLKIKKIEDKLKIVFTGNIGQAQNLDILVEAAVILSKEKFKDVKFTLVGDGRYKDTLMSQVENKQLDDYFEFVERVDYDKIQGILSKHHFGFVSLGQDKALNKTLPAKVQSYMSFGIPILASANGETSQVIKKSKSGISVKANDPKALSQKIKEISNLSQSDLLEMGFNGFTYSNKFFSLENTSQEIIEIMKEGATYV